MIVNILTMALQRYKTDKEELKTLDEIKEINKQTAEKIKQIEATVDGEHDWFLCLTKKKENCEEPGNDE